MKSLVVLSKDDIIRIISQHFKVDSNCVNLKILTRSVGYGLGEQSENYVQAEVSCDSLISILDKKGDV